MTVRPTLAALSLVAGTAAAQQPTTTRSSAGQTPQDTTAMSRDSTHHEGSTQGSKPFRATSRWSARPCSGSSTRPPRCRIAHG